MCEFRASVDPRAQKINGWHCRYWRLALLELKLRQAGLNTDFLRGEYADALLHKINQE